MLLRSQPLDPQICKKLGLDERDEIDEMVEDNIESRHVGKMFDDILDGAEKTKVTLKERAVWKWHDIKNFFSDVRYAVSNFVKWRKTISRLRSWEGFDGLISVMQLHLSNYIEAEEKYGHSEAEYKKSKIISAKETLELLERMRSPDEYLHKRYEEVEAKYPEYKSLITRYKNGGASYSGRFIAYGAGWIGQESGKNPSEGYFEFVDGKFVLVGSPNRNETDRLLAELSRYEEAIKDASRQAEIDSENDFDKLNQLLKENLYSWWD